MTVTSDTDTTATAGTSTEARAGYYRWVICALIFFATTINYVDRQVFSILAPTLEREIHWSEQQYGYIVAVFQWAYAGGLLLAGYIIDKIGTRSGYAWSIIVWSVAAMSHAFAGSPLAFGMARGFLGLGEGGNFPTAIKTIAEWFPRKERALATGIFNGGTNIGAILVPLIVPWLTLTYGWRAAFILTGAIGFLWLFFWLPLYRRPEEHPRLSEGELAYIRSDRPESSVKVSWLKLMPHGQTWAFVTAKFMTDPVWWFYLFWLAKYLDKTYKITLGKLAAPLVIIYVVSDIGSICGGWLSSSLIKRGWSVNSARKTAMLICGLCVIPVIFAWRSSNMWVAVGFIGLATAAHQAWSANVFTLASDMFPRRAVGSVVGLGGMGGAVGGILLATLTGTVLQRTGNYQPMFIIAGTFYLVALLIVHLLAPRLKPVELD